MTETGGINAHIMLIIIFIEVCQSPKGQIMQGESREKGPRDLRGEAKDDNQSVGRERDLAGPIDVAGRHARTWGTSLRKCAYVA
jgi:hypothetical protein